MFNIQEELKRAFHDDVPEGEVLLLKEGNPLLSLLIKSAQPIIADNLLLMPKNESFVKSVKPSGGKTERGYKSEKRATHMMYMRQTGPNEIEIGPVTINYSLKPMPSHDCEIEKFTGTPVIFEEKIE